MEQRKQYASERPVEEDKKEEEWLMAVPGQVPAYMVQEHLQNTVLICAGAGESCKGALENWKRKLVSVCKLCEKLY